MNKVPLRLTFIPAVFSRLAIAILILFTSTAAGNAAEQPVRAPHANTGSIDGRVMNQDTGNYVNNARVFIDALRLETFTDEFGAYIFPRVPAGEAVIRVVYTGLPVQTQTVSVTAGQRAEANISLHTSRTTADAAILLDAFTVASKRDMAASDIAVNEQRFSAGIKNVVSTDSFADIADGNVGEFAKYLPGVTLNRNGSDGINISLGGVPPSGTPILLDGMGIASASSSNPERTVEFENIAVGSMSRMEVTRSPSPDAPASARPPPATCCRRRYSRTPRCGRPETTPRSRCHSHRGESVCRSTERHQAPG